MDLRIHNTNENDSHMKYIEMVRTLFTCRAKHTKVHDWIERQIHKLDKMDSIENIYKQNENHHIAKRIDQWLWKWNQRWDNTYL